MPLAPTLSRAARRAHQAGGALSRARSSPRPATDHELLLLTAALAWVAAAIHATVMPGHFEEWWLAGVFFVVVTALQLGWGALVYRRPDRLVLAAGAVGNVLVAAVWAVSRTVGIPLGQEAWHPEPVGAIDALATLDELVIAGLVVALLSRRRPAAGPTWIVGYVLLIASLLAALLGGHHH